MPQVKSFSWPFDGKPFQQVFKVDSSGMFSSQLPPGFSIVLGFGCVFDTTLEKCEKKVKEAREEYLAARTSTRKVILYHVQSNSRIFKNGCVDFQSSDIPFCHGVAVSVCAGVFEERRTVTGDREHYEYVELDSSLPASMTNGRALTGGCGDKKECLSHTPEIEEVFRRVGLGLEAVILQLDQLKDPEKILSIASTLTNLLPCPQ